MNIENFLIGFETLTHFGVTLNAEKKAILYNALIILQNDNHFRKIFYWGEIRGITRDYYIACGYRKDAMRGRQFYYSTDLLDWVLLPKPNHIDMFLTLGSAVRFQGDPSFGIQIEEDSKKEITENDEAEMDAINEEGRLKEENRLAATVHLINEYAMIVPRGALLKRQDGVIVFNEAFQGLRLLEADELKSYLHYRVPIQRWNTNLLTRKDYNYALDFLDSIDADKPPGQWVLDSSKDGGRTSFVYNLAWPGYYFYHLANTPYYGSIYSGLGKRNVNIPFMM